MFAHIIIVHKLYCIYNIIALRKNEIVLAIINLATFAIEVPVISFTK